MKTLSSEALWLILALVFTFQACSGGGSSSSQNPSVQDPVAQALNEGTAITGTAQSDCGNSVVLEAVNTLCELFGDGSCINQQSSCNSYTRQLYTGSFLSENGTSWNGRGGSGEQMSDAALCILRELSPKVQDGGPLRSGVDINIGIGTVKIRHEVGYSDFDRVNAVFKGYRKMYVELPVLGKFDAVAQDIEVRKTQFGGHSFNPFPFAGDYQIIFGHGLNLTTEEKSKTLDIQPLAFPVVTPLGTFTAQPTFEYRSFTSVVDAHATDHTYVLLPPDDYGEVALRLSDLYGIMPGVNNTTTPKPFLSNYKEKRGGWISQIGLGNRGTNTGSETVWGPPASGVFSRPDYDPSGTLDFLSYAPRSSEENQPSVYAKAAVFIKYPESDPFLLLPGWVKNLPGVSADAYITVTPTIEAGAAGQFGIALSEGTNYYRGGEFALLQNRLAALGIYSGVKANASFEIITQLVINVDATFDMFLGPVTVNIIGIDPKFPIPIAGGTPAGSAVDFASAYSSSDSTPDFLETLDSLKTFKAAKPDPKAFITQCYAEELVSEPTPTPTSEKGNPEDLITNEIWPCNVCMATDEVKDPDTGEIKEPAHSDFLMPATTLPTTWKCDSKAKSGCMDRCSWDKTFDPTTGKPNLIVIAGPLDIANGIPTTDPQHNFFKSCMAPCGVVFGSIAGPPCQKDSTPPQVVTVKTNEAAPFPVSGSITATFNKQMDQATINVNTFMVADRDNIPVEGSIAYDPRSLTASFTPIRSLNFDSPYTVTITTEVRDIDGIPLPADIISNFTTEPQPTRQ